MSAAQHRHLRTGCPGQETLPSRHPSQEHCLRPDARNGGRQGVRVTSRRRVQPRMRARQVAHRTRGRDVAPATTLLADEQRQPHPGACTRFTAAVHTPTQSTLIPLPTTCTSFHRMLRISFHRNDLRASACVCVCVCRRDRPAPSWKAGPDATCSTRTPPATNQP